MINNENFYAPLSKQLHILDNPWTLSGDATLIPLSPLNGRG